MCLLNSKLVLFLLGSQAFTSHFSHCSGAFDRINWEKNINLYSFLVIIHTTKNSSLASCDMIKSSGLASELRTINYTLWARYNASS